MKIHSQNTRPENPIDPIAEKLHAASVEERSKVTNSSEFARRLRAGIENDLQPLSLANQQAVVGKRKSPGKLVAWAMTASTVAAAILLFVSLLVPNKMAPDKTVKSPVEVVRLPGVLIDPTPPLPDVDFEKADAKKGLQLVNSSLGKTIQTISSARGALRDFLQPLRSLNPQLAIEKSASRQPRRPLDVADDQLVALFTARVLGIPD